MKLIQENGTPIYGRMNGLLTEFNIKDYKNDFLRHSLKRKLRYKKFSFIAVQHQQYTFGLAIADLAWIGHGFYYCYDRETQKYLDFHALQPLGMHTQVEELTTRGQFNYFKHPNFQIYTQQTAKFRKVDIYQNNSILAKFKISTVSTQQPLYMCSPSGIRGWTYTHKSMCLPVQGYAEFNGHKIEFDDSSLASLDDSSGFLRRETEWFWLSCQTVIKGQKIGINLASGVNESIGNENCLWIDGQLIGLNDVIFVRMNEQNWHIYSLDGGIDLMVTNGWRRYENVNAGIVASQFSQWVAEIKGKIGNIENQINIDHAYAIFEQHYAKW